MWRQTSPWWCVGLACAMAPVSSALKPSSLAASHSSNYALACRTWRGCMSQRRCRPGCLSSGPSTCGRSVNQVQPACALGHPSVSAPAGSPVRRSGAGAGPHTARTAPGQPTRVPDPDGRYCGGPTHAVAARHGAATSAAPMVGADSRTRAARVCATVRGGGLIGPWKLSPPAAHRGDPPATTAPDLCGAGIAAAALLEQRAKWRQCPGRRVTLDVACATPEIIQAARGVLSRWLSETTAPAHAAGPFRPGGSGLPTWLCLWCMCGSPAMEALLAAPVRPCAGSLALATRAGDGSEGWEPICQRFRVPWWSRVRAGGLAGGVLLLRARWSGREQGGERPNTRAARAGKNAGGPA